MHPFLLTYPAFLTSSVSAFTKKPKTQTAEIGATVIFEAETEKPDIKVRWQRDSKDIASSYKYTISAEGNMHSLTINNIVREDAVGYAVIAGVSKVKFELKIKESEGGWCLDGDSRLPVLNSLLLHLWFFVFVNQSHSTTTNSFPIHFSRNCLAFEAPF